jgi:hypothetical protein
MVTCCGEPEAKSDRHGDRGQSRVVPATRRIIRDSATPLLVAETAAAAAICPSVVIATTITAPLTATAAITVTAITTAAAA